MSLRLRILLLIGAVNVGVLLLVVGIGLQAQPSDAVSRAAVVEALSFALDDDFDEERLRASKYVDFVVKMQGAGEEFRTFFLAGLEESTEAASRLLDERVRAGVTGMDQDADGLAVFFATPQQGTRASYVHFNDHARFAAREGLRSVYLSFMAGTVVLILVTFLLLNGLVLRPLDRLARASSAVAEGATPVPLPRTGRGDEMDRLNQAFNRMTREVHEYQESLEERVMDALMRVTAAERRLMVAQRLAATGTLAAGIAHEINNPLGGIINATERLREGRLPPERREEYYEIVYDGLDHIRSIVERVLHFAPSRGEPLPVNAAEVCRRAADLARHRADQRGIRLEVEAGESVDGVMGDTQELQEAVINLILNAVDAIPEGRDGTVTVSARTEGAEVVLEVADDGVGMDDEIRRRCVDPFYSTKEEGKGTGLGLGIVQHIATDHGGSLEIESEAGKGTRVRMRLPVAGGR